MRESNFTASLRYERSDDDYDMEVSTQFFDHELILWSVEGLESFDPVNSVSDLVMCGSEAASKAEAVEESKLYDRFPPIFVLCSASQK